MILFYTLNLKSKEFFNIICYLSIIIANLKERTLGNRMKKFIMMMSTAAILATSSFADNYINSIAEYERVTKQGNVIIDFYAPWCLPCKELGYNLKKLKVNKEFVKIYKINVDENPDLQALYAKPMIPTLIYMKDGKVIDGHIGSKTTAQLENDIANYFY